MSSLGRLDGNLVDWKGSGHGKQHVALFAYYNVEGRLIADYTDM